MVERTHVTFLRWVVQLLVGSPNFKEYSYLLCSEGDDMVEEPSK